jgi:hypothetical protein
LGFPRSKAMVNLVMALASCQEAKSPVELSLSPVYHYQYGSISKAIAHLARDDQERSAILKSFRQLCLLYLDGSVLQPYLLLQTDVMPACKPHSPTLKDRTYVAIPNNVIPGNKPLDVGYEVSFVNIGDLHSSWSLPLSSRRVSVDQTASECALGQLKELLEHPDLGFSDILIINTLDSKYGNASFLAPAHRHENVVNITRMRSGMKVWKRDRQIHTGGAPNIYGDKFYLIAESRIKTYPHPKTKESCEVFQRSIFDLQADETLQISAQTTKGRPLTVHLWRWNGMMIRSKAGNNMKDKPFDLIAVRVLDAQTQERLFGQDMFIALNGKQKTDVTTEQGYASYRCRYDIEPYFRFAKQTLMLQKLQTPDVEHFDNWLLSVQFASWLLYTASKEARFRPRKWEKYLPENKQAETAQQLSIAQTRKSAQDLFLTFDADPFKPKKSKKGKGRQKGDKQTPRIRYKVLKKTTKASKTKQKIEQIE